MSSISLDERIGFIGTGQMGTGVINALLKKSHRVLCFDLNTENLHRAVLLGAERAGSIEEIVQNCRVVFLCIRPSQATINTLKKDIYPFLREGQCIVDLGTSDVAETRSAAELFLNKKVSLIDSPVSGGEERAWKGLLYLFPGGEKRAVDEIRTILEAIGDPEHICYCGKSGNGQLMKGTNQLAMGLSDAAYMEAFSYAYNAGVDPHTIRKAMGSEEGFRACFEKVGSAIVHGQGEDLLTKYPEYGYFFKVAQEDSFKLPITEAIARFMESEPHDLKDNMHNNRPSFWRALIKNKERNS